MSPRSIRSTRSRPRWKAYEVTTIEDTLGRGDIYVTTTGNVDIITFEHMGEDEKPGRRLRTSATSTTRFRSTALNAAKDIKRTNIKPQVDKYTFADGHEIFMLAEGRLVNLGCATGHPSFVMSNSFSNQVLAQLDLWTEQGHIQAGVYVLQQRARRRSGPPASREDWRETDAS